MKRIKNFFVKTLGFACAFTSLFAIAACGDDDESSSSQGGGGGHTHSYTAVVTDPTCTAEGYTTHTCTCGDSYVDTKVPAKGHQNTTEIVKYPAVGEKGEKKQTCSVCGATTTKDIAAITVNLPTVSDVLQAVIGSANYKLTVEEGSELQWVYDNFEYLEEEEEYIETTELRKIKVELAEAVINTEDTFQGHLKVKVKAFMQSFDLGEEVVVDMNQAIVGEFYLYVNGDTVSVEIVTDGVTNTTEVALTEVVYEGVVEFLNDVYGVQPLPPSFDGFVEMAYTLQEAGKYAAVLSQIMSEINAPEISGAYIEKVQTLLETFGQNIIVETTEDGFTTYAVDVEAFKVFLEEIDGKTIGAYADDVFGAGTTAQVREFLVALPDMKVKEIAVAAIQLAENYGVSVEELYDFISYVIYKNAGVSVSIQNEIESRYEMTIGEIILDLSGEGAPTIAQIKESIGMAFDQISAITIDEIFEMYFAQPEVEEGGMGAEVTADSEEEQEIGFVEAVSNALEMFSEVLTIEATVEDETGAIVAMEVSLAMGERFYGITYQPFYYEGTIENEDEGTIVSGDILTITTTMAIDDEENETTIYETVDVLEIRNLVGQSESVYATLFGVQLGDYGLSYTESYMDDSSTYTRFMVGYVQEVAEDGYLEVDGDLINYEVRSYLYEDDENEATYTVYEMYTYVKDAIYSEFYMYFDEMGNFEFGSELDVFMPVYGEDEETGEMIQTGSEWVSFVEISGGFVQSEEDGDQYWVAMSSLGTDLQLQALIQIQNEEEFDAIIEFGGYHDEALVNFWRFYKHFNEESNKYFIDLKLTVDGEEMFIAEVDQDVETGALVGANVYIYTTTHEWNPETEEYEECIELAFDLYYEDNSTEESVEKLFIITRPLMDNKLVLQYVANATGAEVSFESYDVEGDEVELLGEISVGYQFDEENPEITTFGFVYRAIDIAEIIGEATVNAGVLESMDIDGEISAVRSVPSYDDQGNSDWLYFESIHTFEINYENGEFTIYYTEDEQEEVGGELVKQGELTFVVNAEGVTFTMDAMYGGAEMAFNVLDNGVSLTMKMEFFDYDVDGERVVDEVPVDVELALTMEEEGLQFAYDIVAWTMNNAIVSGAGSILLQNMGR